MKQEGIRYYAEEGKLIVRKADDFIMGDAICLGEYDSIDNYVEQDFTEEEIKAFFESLDLPYNKKEVVENNEEA